MSQRLRARILTFTLFGIGGFVTGLWIVYIPTISGELGIDHDVLGLLLLLQGTGAIVAMQFAGRIADRFGPGRTAIGFTVALCASLLGPAFANSIATLAVALFVMGMFVGSTDVAMNAHGVRVEELYGRPIFSAFHALWSIGGLAISLIGAGMLAAGLPRGIAMPLVAAIAALIALGMWRFALAADVGIRVAPRTETGSIILPDKPPTIWYFIFLGVITAFAFVAEGAVGDWAPLFAQTILDAPEPLTPLTFGAFSLAMTIGRFTSDRVVSARGSRWVVRWGTLLAILSLTWALLVPSLWLSLIGWFGLGIGLAGLVPQLFLAASRSGDPAKATQDLAKVVGISYAGLLAGPSLIGFLTLLMPLNAALLAVNVLLLAIWLAAPHIRGLATGPDRTTSR